MAIIELAHIQLTHGITTSEPTLISNLKDVKRVIEQYSGLPTLFYEQVDDPSVLFVIGGWPSKEKHEHGFSGSPQQAKILDLVKDQMDITWMQYMDIDQNEIPLEAPVIGVIKETMPKHIDKDAIDQNFAEVTRNLGGARYGAVAAWNLRKHKHDHDIRVHFSGWENTDEATSAMVDMIEHADGFRVKPTDLMFFFAKQVNLD